MIDDRLQIDLVNPTTWTGDFGVPHDGFRKDLFIDGSYTTAIDEEPTDYTDDLALKPKDLAGNIHLKTISPNYAPHGAFPTRKFEYSDGTVTWYRPLLPWSWMGKGQQGLLSGKKGRDVLLILFILVLVFYILSRLKK
jgi:hypothetical protein